MRNLPAAGNSDRLSPIASERRPSEPGAAFNQLGPLPDSAVLGALIREQARS